VQAVATRLADGRRILWRPSRPAATRSSTAAPQGGGKSAGLIAIPLRWVKNPNFSALILRRDTTQLGDLLKKAEKLYPPPAASRRRTAPRSRGSSERRLVWFTHCQHEDDVARFDGWEFQLVEFDELTHFTEKQYKGIRARIRSPHPNLPRYTRSTSNPGGEGTRLGVQALGRLARPELQIEGLPKGDGIEAPVEPGVVLWFATRNGVEVCVRRASSASQRTSRPLSRTFIPARSSRTTRASPSTTRPTSRTSRQLDPVRRAARGGDWLVSYTAGSLFRRQWWKFIDKPPAEVLSRWRAWDRAATAPHEGNKDPDWTRGVKISRAGPLFFVEDMVSMRDGAARRPQADAEHRRDGRVDTSIALFRDPGSAGKDEEASMLELLAGFNVHSQPATGDKVSRARPFSAQVEPGNVYLVRGAWNEEFIQELEPSRGGRARRHRRRRVERLLPRGSGLRPRVLQPDLHDLS
jgi:predicted phage terminase large subunit-like protein